MPKDVIAAVAALALALPAAAAYAQNAPPTTDAKTHHASMMAPDAAALPTLSGQDAFGAIQEILRILEADPNTDWSRVNIEVLREHLIDMNELTLHARATATMIDGGVRIVVTGEGRTLSAIQRMVPAQARAIDGVNGWKTDAEPLADGIALTVTAADSAQVLKIRALGFIGIMAEGAHHQQHHLALARGEPMP